jgi:hypothetical protein
MRNFHLQLSLLSCLALGLSFSACKSRLERDIIGSFHSIVNFSEQPEGEEVSLEGVFESTEEFFKDKSFLETIHITYTYPYSEGSYNLFYQGTIGGNWKIEKSNLYYYYDMESFSFGFVNSDAPEEEQERAAAFNARLLPQLTSDLKEALLHADKDPVEIIEINSTRLMSRCKNGEEMIQQRLRN